MGTAGGKTLVHTGSHWGIYDVEGDNGRVVGVRADDKDPRPSRIIASLPGAVHTASRITRPMVRQGWLEHGVGNNRARHGVGPFDAMSWDEALDLVAAELRRVKAPERLSGNKSWQH